MIGYAFPFPALLPAPLQLQQQQYEFGVQEQHLRDEVNEKEAQIAVLKERCVQLQALIDSEAASVAARDADVTRLSSQVTAMRSIFLVRLSIWYW
jgi:hypothetical protein